MTDYIDLLAKKYSNLSEGTDDRVIYTKEIEEVCVAYLKLKNSTLTSDVPDTENKNLDKLSESLQILADKYVSIIDGTPIDLKEVEDVCAATYIAMKSRETDKIMFQSAASGLWYENLYANIHAAGDISAIKINEHLYNKVKPSIETAIDEYTIDVAIRFIEDRLYDERCIDDPDVTGTDDNIRGFKAIIELLGKLK
jgi:hypothetical protein